MMKHHLAIIEHTEALLAQIPTRQTLAHIPSLPVNNRYKLRVERTMPFEWIGQLLTPFCHLWQADITIDYSSYDPSLSQTMTVGEGDENATIFWIDWRLYKDKMTAEQAVDWISERVKIISQQRAKPVLINNWFEHWDMGEKLFSPTLGERHWFRSLNKQLTAKLSHIASCELIDLAGWQVALEQPLYDGRNDELSNFPFSNHAATAIARHIAVHLLPALFKPRIKVIVLDLDDTLYEGVIGEDGSDGIALTSGHEQFQQLLLQLKQSGILLAICSRNEAGDVRQLFIDRHRDFPLQWQDFAVVCANWQPKSDNITTISEKLNIDPSDFLFIDDNGAELMKTVASYPQLRLLKAAKDGSITAQMLSHYPGLYQFRASQTDHLRNEDIQANETREQLKAQSTDQHAYLSALDIVIHIHVNHSPHKQRLYELSQKTNQFNLGLQRLSVIDIENMLQDPQYAIFSISLSDALSDSGIIGSVIVHIDDKDATIHELVFSCRALGRDVESVAFAHVLRHIVQEGVETLHVMTTDGPRNMPALRWLHRFTDGNNEQIELRAMYDKVQQVCANHPAEVKTGEK